MRKALLAFTAVAGIGFAAGTANAGWIVGGTNTGPAPANNDFTAELAGFDLWSPATLGLTGDVVGVDFFYVGSESDFDNTFEWAGGAGSFTETGDANLFGAPQAIGSTGTTIDYEFISPIGTFSIAASDPEFGVFFDPLQPNIAYFALDDDGAGPDDNHDDIVILAVARTADVPEPGILALIGAGLLGTGFAARRRRNG